MKIRFLVAGLVTTGAVLGAAIFIWGAGSNEPVPPGLAEASNWLPEPPAAPGSSIIQLIRPALTQAEGAVSLSPLPLLEVAVAVTCSP